MGAYMGHMGAVLGHACAHIWATWEQQWGMHARIHGPYMGAAMGHACAHTWAIYGGSNGACMRAYMAIYGSPIGRAGRKGTTGNPFPSLVIPSLPFPVPQRNDT